MLLVAATGVSCSGAALPVQRQSEASISNCARRRVGCCIQTSTIIGAIREWLTLWSGKHPGFLIVLLPFKIIRARYYARHRLDHFFQSAPNVQAIAYIIGPSIDDAIMDRLVAMMHPMVIRRTS